MKQVRMRFLTALTLSAGLFFQTLSPVPVSAAERSTLSGSGTKADPYLITSASDLSAFAASVSQNKKLSGKLTADITVENWSPIAPYTGSKDDAYTGVFDGGSHTVTIRGSQGDYSGLFGYNKGTIKNVTIEGTITGTESAGGIASVNRGTIDGCVNRAFVSSSHPVSFAGGIAGSNFGTIRNCSNAGAIFSDTAGTSIGGIAGAAMEGTLQSVRNTGTVTLEVPSETDSDYTEGTAGGITGINYQCRIEQAENEAMIRNTDLEGYTGGIAGLNNGTIRNSLNGGTVDGTHYAGGIAGYLFGNEEAGEASVIHAFSHGSILQQDAASHSSGAICGRNDNGTAVDNFYLDGSSPNGIPNTEDGAIAKSRTEMENGSVTYLLNGQSSANPVWKQTIGNGSAPGFQSEDTVYASYTSETEEPAYTNTRPEHTEADHKLDDTGTCTVCGHHTAKAAGHSLTLDGSIGANFYYNLEPQYYEEGSGYCAEVTFTVNNKTTKAAFDASKVLEIDGQSAFGFSVQIDSDEMTFPIRAVLEIKKDGEVLYTVRQEPYRVYDYLLTVIHSGKETRTDADGNTLVSLARSLATYDYYSTDYFRYHEPYEEETPLLSLQDITADTLSSHAWETGAYDSDAYTYRHYASSLQFKTTTNLVLMAQVRTGREDTGNLYLGYRKQGSDEPYTYTKTKKIVNGATSYYQASIDAIPSSELATRYETAFFRKTDSSYEQVTPVKTGSAYSYLHMILKQESSKEASKNLAKAFYLYAEASQAYFSSETKEGKE